MLCVESSIGCTHKCITDCAVLLSTMAVNFEITGYSGKKEICTTIPKYKESANYFECQKPVIGNRLDVDLKSRRTFEICEVEVFQTKTGKNAQFSLFFQQMFLYESRYPRLQTFEKFAKYLKFVLLLYRSTICSLVS